MQIVISTIKKFCQTEETTNSCLTFSVMAFFAILHLFAVRATHKEVKEPES